MNKPFARLSAVLLFALAGTSLMGGEDPLSRIAFGSCLKEDRPQPIWFTIVDAQPEMFLFIGDAIYGDSSDRQILLKKWGLLGADPGYQKLKATCPILATWDDHDMGKNDAGAEFAAKTMTQELFLDFFDEPADSPRRKQEGVYDAKIFGPEGKRVQIILLDTRTFRSPLNKVEHDLEPGEGIEGPYGPSTDPSATMLGEVQWQWLEAQLLKPAEVRVIASSIQLISRLNGWEKWENFPQERQRFFDLLKSTHANGVVVISGDRHTAEISRLDCGLGYPLYDVTSSSLNQPHRWRSELNPDRVGGMYYDENFGMVLIDWTQPDPVVRVQVVDLLGRVALQVRHPLSELKGNDSQSFKNAPGPSGQ